MPLVEKHAKRTFTATVVVEKMTAAQHQQRLADEFEWIYTKLMPDTPPAIRDGAAMNDARMMMAGALGKYDLLEKRVYLNAEALPVAMARARVPESRTRDVIRVLLAHEITHALEDQQIDLVRTVEHLHDPEQMQAASSTWEGLSTFVSQRVAQDLGVEDLFWTLSGLQGWGPDGLQEISQWYTWAAYGQGYRFIAAREAAGGMDAAWATLERPPAGTSQIWRPETWDPTVPSPPRDYTALLRGVEQSLTRGDWVVANTRVGETTLRGEAVNDPGGFAALDEALGHLVWAHALELKRADRAGDVRVLEFDEPAWALRWIEILRAQRTAVNASEAADLGVPIEVITEPFEDAPGDAAILRIERIPIGEGRHLERHAAWVVRGRFVVAVTAERFRPGLRMGWTVEEVFRRLDGQPPTEGGARTSPEPPPRPRRSDR